MATYEMSDVDQAEVEVSQGININTTPGIVCIIFIKNTPFKIVCFTVNPDWISEEAAIGNDHATQSQSQRLGINYT